MGEDVGPELSGGKHTIKLFLEDNNNEASLGSVWVMVKDGLYIERILNYPNPFEDGTTLTYMLTDQTAEVRARIYTITGRLVRELKDLPTVLGYNEYQWDGKDNNDNEIGNDVYFLVILAKDSKDNWVKGRGKVVKLK